MLSKFLTNGAMVALGRCLLFGSAIVLARLLGPDQYGQYAYLAALVMFLAVPAQSGLGELLTRDIAASRPEHLGARAAGILGAAWKLLAANLALAALILMLLVPPLSRQLATAEPGVTMLILVSVAAVAVIGLSSGLLRGLHKVSWALLPREFVYPALFIALLLAVGPSDAPRALSLYAAAFMLAALASIVLVWRLWPRSKEKHEPGFTAGQVFSMSWPFAMIAILSLVIQRVDILVLGAFVSSSEIGIYNVAAQLALIASLPLAVFNGIAAPRLAQFSASGALRDIRDVTGKGSLALAALAIAGVAIFYIIGEALIALAFGDAFRGAFWPCLILLLGQLVNLTCGPMGLLLNMAGHEKITLQGLVIGAIGSIALCLLLIPVYGIMGAACASLVAMIMWNAYLSLQVYRRIGILPGPAALLQNLERKTP